MSEINMLKYLIDMSKLYIDLNEVGEQVRNNFFGSNT